VCAKENDKKNTKKKQKKLKKNTKKYKNKKCKNTRDSHPFKNFRWLIHHLFLLCADGWLIYLFFCCHLLLKRTIFIRHWQIGGKLFLDARFLGEPKMVCFAPLKWRNREQWKQNEIVKTKWFYCVYSAAGSSRSEWWTVKYFFYSQFVTHRVPACWEIEQPVAPAFHRWLAREKLARERIRGL
jgi:hypothetical protein